MNAEMYHRSMKPLEEACRLAKSEWVCLPCPLVGGKAMILLRHMALVSKVWKSSRQRILVREFSTLPLLSVFPFLWPWRKKIVFMIHHNLQWAVCNPLERIGLMLLAKLGARWALLETQNFPNLGTFNIPADHNLVVSHPVPPVFSRPWKNGENPVVGVAGYYRPEKGMDELVCLLKEKLPRFRILLGVPNPEAVKHLDVETVCTASNAEYQRMLGQCDVLVQAGAKESYFYRASGPISDAAVCRTAVVAPDFPIIGKQVAGIGEVFQTLEKIPERVQRAVDHVRKGQYDFEKYCENRSVKTLAECLDRFSNGKS